MLYLFNELVCLVVVPVPNARLVCVQQVFIDHILDLNDVVVRGPHASADVGLGGSVGLLGHAILAVFLLPHFSHFIGCKIPTCFPLYST